MNVLLVNDTSSYHAGSSAVVQFIVDALSEHTIIGRVPSVQPMVWNQWDNIEAVIVNGEGTMHHDRIGANAIKQITNQALDLGIPVSLINSLWQDMDKSWQNILPRLHYWNVRDRLSLDYAVEEFEPTPDFFPDFAWYVKPCLSTQTQRTHAILGGFFSSVFALGWDWPEHATTIFEHTWQSWCEELSRARFLVSGRHHEIYGACLARCPFVPVAGNSWKIEGLMHNAGVEIPVLQYPPISFDFCQQFVETHNDDYLKLWQWLDNQPCPDPKKWLPH